MIRMPVLVERKRAVCGGRDDIRFLVAGMPFSTHFFRAGVVVAISLCTLLDYCGACV